MESCVQKWGNSLAVRIPKALAEELGLQEKSRVTLSLRHGELVISPTVETDRDLERLLAQVTEDNLHCEVDTGPARGNEAW